MGTRLRRFLLAIVAASLLDAANVASAEGGQRGAPPAGGGAAVGAKAAAPVDLTGYWVSLVTEDWIERMSPDSPASGTGGGIGGFGGGGGAARGRGAAPPATPPANADPCRAYGAGGSMRLPGRLNITWADDDTLKIEIDAGTQTRLMHFNQVPSTSQRTLQGHSIASWDTGVARGGFGGGGGRGGRGGAAALAARWGQLKVVTTNMTTGYLLSSRNSYSENAVLTEYFAPHQDFGTDYLTVVASIEDGGQPRMVSSTFKKEPNGSKFKPTGCEVVR